MTRTDVIQKMQEIVDRIFLEKVTLSPGLTAKEVEEWDSLMQISIVVAIEQAFQVKFHLGEVEATKNVGEFADLILKRLKG